MPPTRGKDVHEDIDKIPETRARFTSMIELDVGLRDDVIR